jgi:hypothetical protein
MEKEMGVAIEFVTFYIPPWKASDLISACFKLMSNGWPFCLVLLFTGRKQLVSLLVGRSLLSKGCFLWGWSKRARRLVE